MTPTTEPKSTVTGMDIVVHLTADAARSIAFYRDVLGLTPTGIDPDGRGSEFELPDGSTFGVWHPDDGPQTGATIMFAVDDIAAAVGLFNSRGARLSPPTETPVCHMSFGTDPDGNAFIVHQRKSGASH
jgi:predicted enzyme related to lactoylglutathione lyase